jgi:hypothetical protein
LIVTIVKCPTAAEFSDSPWQVLLWKGKLNREPAGNSNLQKELGLAVFTQRCKEGAREGGKGGRSPEVSSDLYGGLKMSRAIEGNPESANKVDLGRAVAATEIRAVRALNFLLSFS